MTNTEIRIAMAEVDGWTDTGEAFYHPDKGYSTMTGVSLPNYPNDLNAVHEVEKKLTIDQRREYYKQFMLLYERQDENRQGTSYFNFMHTTALQRCEAILRTLNKWKD